MWTFLLRVKGLQRNLLCGAPFTEFLLPTPGKYVLVEVGICVPRHPTPGLRKKKKKNCKNNKVEFNSIGSMNHACTVQNETLQHTENQKGTNRTESSIHT